MHEVRLGDARDLPRINEIYNHYIRTSHCTFDIDEHDAQWREKWFETFENGGSGGRYQLFVATDGDRLAGYAYTGAFRDRAAYSTSVETSVYIDASFAARGIGSALYEALFDAIAKADVHRIYAGIALPNDPSVALHKRFGFDQVALFSEQGRKFDRYWDVAWFEKRV